VIYIQHASDRVLPFGSADWQLHPRLHPGEGDLIVHKQHGNAFEDTFLHRELAARSVGRVIVTGLVTHGCVKATCKGALALGYRSEELDALPSRGPSLRPDRASVSVSSAMRAATRAFTVPSSKVPSSRLTPALTPVSISMPSSMVRTAQMWNLPARTASTTSSLSIKCC
jgi:hypothetical protein